MHSSCCLVAWWPYAGFLSQKGSSSANILLAVAVFTCFAYVRRLCLKRSAKGGGSSQSQELQCHVPRAGTTVQGGPDGSVDRELSTTRGSMATQVSAKHYYCPTAPGGTISLLPPNSIGGSE